MRGDILATNRPRAHWAEGTAATIKSTVSDQSAVDTAIRSRAGRVLFSNAIWSKLTVRQMLAHKPIHSSELRIDKSRTSGFRQATAARKMPAADRLSDALDRLDLLGSW